MRYNEKNGALFNESVLFYDINDPTPVFEVSCFIIGDLTGIELKANYDIIVYGDIEMDSITVMGNLTCLGSCNAKTINVNGNCYIKNNLELINGVIGEKLQAKELEFDTIEVKSGIISESIDFSNELICGGKCIISEGITGEGIVNCEIVICGEYSLIDELPQVIVASEIEEKIQSCLSEVDEESIEDQKKCRDIEKEVNQNSSKMEWEEFEKYLEEVSLIHSHYNKALNQYRLMLSYSDKSKLCDLKEIVELASLIYLSEISVCKSDLATVLKDDLLIKSFDYMYDLRFPKISRYEFADLLYKINSIKYELSVEAYGHLEKELFGKIGLKYNTVCMMLGE